jgi:endonuclease G, mitochondrial
MKPAAASLGPLRKRLLDLLVGLPGIQDFSFRTSLLFGIPDNVMAGLTRNAGMAMADVATYLHELERLGRLEATGERPLVIIIENALRATRGTTLGRELEELRAALERAYGTEPPSPLLAPLTRELLVFGGRDQRVDHAFFATALERARAVCRLLVPRFFDGHEDAGRFAYGTGWLAAPGLLFTNHHVLAARGEKESAPSDADFRRQGERALAWFDYHLEGGTHVQRRVRTILASDQELDYALLELEDGEGFADRRLPIAPATVALERSDCLNIIQHPNGGPARFAVRNNFYAGPGERSHHLRYFTDTESGASGSPVFDDRWTVVAMHHAYCPVPPALYQDASGRQDKVKYHNQGIVMAAIMAHLPPAARDRIAASQGWPGH